jgi:hypothetical protein
MVELERLLGLCELRERTERAEKRSAVDVAELERAAGELSATGGGGPQLERLIAAAISAYWRVACLRALVDEDVSRLATSVNQLAGNPEA